MQRMETGSGGSTPGPVLYKCPYCAKGRFRGPNGWNEAIAHIKTHKIGERAYRGHHADDDRSADESSF
jgi:hypothetical protein